VDWVDKFGDWERSLAPGFWDGLRNLLTGGSTSEGYTAADGTLSGSLFGGAFQGTDRTGSPKPPGGIPWALIFGVVSLVLLLVVMILVLLR
jgi:hypothetical protein